MGTEKFCLRWNDFESNISVAFRELREEKDFFDVTLSCDDEQQLPAHKVILSACSPFFKNILRRNPHQHPLLYLKGVKYTDLQSVLNFMYHGEVNVAQDELNSFLAVAEDLRVKGLTQSNQTSSSNSSAVKHSTKASTPPPPPPSSQKLSRPPSEPPSSAPPLKRPRPAAATSSFSQPPGNSEDDDDIQEVVPVKSEPRDLAAPAAIVSSGGSGVAGVGGADTDAYENALATEEDDGAYDESYEDYGQYDQSYDGTLADPSLSADGNKDRVKDLYSYIVKCEDGSGHHRCVLCGKTGSQRVNVRKHVENIHFPGTLTWPCKHCGECFSTRTNLNNHITKHHSKFQLAFSSSSITNFDI